NNRTFSNVHFVQLGEGLHTHEWIAAADEVAEYVFCNAVTPAKHWCGAANKNEEEGQSSSVKSFRVHQIGGSNASLGYELAQHLRTTVVTSWRGSLNKTVQTDQHSLSDPTSLMDSNGVLSAARYRELEVAAMRMLGESEIDVAALRKTAEELLVQEVGGF